MASLPLLQERIAKANALDAKTAAESDILQGSKTIRGKKFKKKTVKRTPMPATPNNNRVSVIDNSESDPLADAARERLANMQLGKSGGGGGRAAALSKLGGSSGWQTTHHKSVAAAEKPFNKFAQASGARYEQAGEATSGSNMDTGRWKSG